MLSPKQMFILPMGAMNKPKKFCSTPYVLILSVMYCGSNYLKFMLREKIISALARWLLNYAF